MDPFTTFLAIVAALAVVALVLILRTVSARERQIAELKASLETNRQERDEARKESREARKTAEGLGNDLKEIRKDLKDAKKKAFKAGEKAKQAESRTPRAEGWSPSKERRLKDIEDAYEQSQATVEALRGQVASLEQRQATDAQADAARVHAPDPSGEDGARIRQLVNQLDRLEERLERTRSELDEERASAKSRDRDLVTARKLAVQHERSFQVVRGQLDILRERMAEAEAMEPESNDDDGSPDTDDGAPSADGPIEASA